MVEISKERLALLKKLKKLQEVMGSFSWEKDGINRHQSYTYITEKQYKHNFEQALQEAGLLWKMETTDYKYIPNVTERQHMVICQFTGRLTDPDTGEYEEYRFNGSGADSGDKALYKAVTGGHKFFIASNFNIAESNDPESDEDDVPKATRPATPEKREEIKDGLIDKDGKATKMQINSLKKALKLLREADPEQEEFIGAIAQKTQGFTNINKTACETLILKVGEMIEVAKGKEAS